MTVTKQKSSTAYNEVNKAYLKSELRCIRKNSHGGKSSKRRLSFGDELLEGDDPPMVLTVPSKPCSRATSPSTTPSGSSTDPESESVSRSPKPLGSVPVSLLSSILSTKPLNSSDSDNNDLILTTLVNNIDLSSTNNHGSGDNRVPSCPPTSHDQLISEEAVATESYRVGGVSLFPGSPVPSDPVVHEPMVCTDPNANDQYPDGEQDNDEGDDDLETRSNEDEEEDEDEDNQSSSGENSHPSRIFCTEHIGNVLLDGK